MGSINIDNTGSGGGVTLSSDGTDLLLDGSAIGGGGGGDPDLYRDNASSATTPVASGSNAISIGSQSEATGSGSVSIGVDATSSMTNSLALGNYTDAIGNTGATAIGYSAQSAGLNAMALQRSYASGTDSFAAAIANNTSSYGATSVYSVALGQQNKASGPWSFAAGGLGNIASQSMSVAIGRSNTASGERSFSLGSFNVASGYASFSYGTQSKAAERGKKSFASGYFAAAGDAQGGQFILRVSTTDATPTVLSTDNGSSLSTSQIIAASDTAITFDGTITAMQNGAQAYASWKIEGLLVNDGGTTTLANSATTVIQNSSGWGMALSADNTNNALAITCTGEAAHNIRWVANIRTTEVTYA